MSEQTIEKFFMAIRELNCDAFAENFAEGAEVTDPVGSSTLKGKSAVRAHFSEVLAAFKQIDLRAERSFICGNQAAVFFKGTGTGKSGRSAPIEGIDLYEFDAQGKILQLKGYWDPKSVLAKIQG